VLVPTVLRRTPSTRTAALLHASTAAPARQHPCTPAPQHLQDTAPPVA